MEKKIRIIKRDYISSDDCCFCGEECGHYFEAVKRYSFGYEDKNGSLVLVNTCGDYSWICRECWGKIKNIFVIEKKGGEMR